MASSKEYMAAYYQAHKEEHRADAAARASAWYYAHRDEVAVRHAEWKIAHPGARTEQAERAALKREERRVRLAGRPRPVAGEICGAEDRPIVWDHDHMTGLFRAWLCSDCNFTLGQAHDNPAVLRALADLLESCV